MNRGVGAELWRAQQAHRSAMYESLADVGLTPPQYAALKILEDAPGVSSAEVARRAFVSAQTMQAIVASLERRDLLVRRARPSGRALAAWPTDRGLAALAVARNRAQEVESRMTVDLTDQEHHLLIELLRRCATSLEGPGRTSALPVAEGKDDR
jgi:DNA-binding MarR family transcriptional regulator